MKFCKSFLPSKLGTFMNGQHSTLMISATCESYSSIVKATTDATLSDHVSLSIRWPNLDSHTMKCCSNCMPCMSVSNTKSHRQVGLTSVTKCTLYQTMFSQECIKACCKISPYRRQGKHNHQLNLQFLCHQLEQPHLLHYPTTLTRANNYSPGVISPDLNLPSCLTQYMKKCYTTDVP